MSADNDASVIDQPKHGRVKKVRPQIQPCLIPGSFYFVGDLVKGGVGSYTTFTKWFNSGKLKPVNPGCRRYIIAANDLIAIWASQKTG